MATANDSVLERSIAIGCVALPPGMGRAGYFGRLSFLELRFVRDQMPGQRVLERWRAEAGGAGRLSLVAPRELAACHRTTATVTSKTAEADRLAAAANAAGAAAVVFHTPPDLSPGPAHRDALRRFFAEIASPARMGEVVRVWVPGGLWRPREAAAFAADLDGLVAAIDPLATDPLDEPTVDGPPAPGDIAYARVSGLGRAQRQLGNGELMRIADWITPARRAAYVVFDTAAKLRDALAFQRWVAQSAAAESGSEPAVNRLGSDRKA